MKKSAVGIVVALVVLLLCVAVQWKETRYSDGGTIVLLRTNRFTGATQVFHRETGWVRPGATSGNAALDSVVAKIIAQRHAH